MCFNSASAGHPLKCGGNLRCKFAAHEIKPMELRVGQLGLEKQTKSQKEKKPIHNKHVVGATAANVGK